jgi:hypothetical protein
VIPTTDNRTDKELNLTVNVSGKNLKFFFVDEEASTSLIQPEVGIGLSHELQYVVRDITGRKLEIQGLRCLSFQLGTRKYKHILSSKDHH